MRYPASRRSASKPLRQILLFASVLLWASLALQAQNGDDGRLSQFVRVSAFDVSVDGSIDRKAQVFQSPQPKALLIRSPQLEDAVVLQVEGNRVASLSQQLLQIGTDKALLDAGYSLKDEGNFSLTRTSLDFTFEGHQMQMRAKQDLLGFISSQDIRDFDSLWDERQAACQPSQEALERIRAAAAGHKVRVVTYFGSWCPHCQKRLPCLMKMEEQLAGSDIDFDYYGIPRPPAFGRDPEAVEKKLESVPTSIVYQEGKEIGRMTRDDWTNPEESLVNLLPPTP